jgi:hypothetical protein
MKINPLPEYEMKLLTAMATFLGREASAQATAALAMYLRQNCDRLLTQCEYYGQQWGMSKWEVLNLCSEQPEKVREMLRGETVHRAEDQADVFTGTSDS